MFQQYSYQYPSTHVYLMFIDVRLEYTILLVLNVLKNIKPFQVVDSTDLFYLVYSICMH